MKHSKLIISTIFIQNLKQVQCQWTKSPHRKEVYWKIWDYYVFQYWLRYISKVLCYNDVVYLPNSFYLASAISVDVTYNFEYRETTLKPWIEFRPQKPSRQLEDFWAPICPRSLPQSRSWKEHVGEGFPLNHTYPSDMLVPVSLGMLKKLSIQGECVRKCILVYIWNIGIL